MEGEGEGADEDAGCTVLSVPLPTPSPHCCVLPYRGEHSADGRQLPFVGRIASDHRPTLRPPLSRSMNVCALTERWILQRHRSTCASASYPHQQPTSTADGSDHPRFPVAKQWRGRCVFTLMKPDDEWVQREGAKRNAQSQMDACECVRSEALKERSE